MADCILEEGGSIHQSKIQTAIEPPENKGWIREHPNPTMTPAPKRRRPPHPPSTPSARSLPYFFPIKLLHPWPNLATAPATVQKSILRGIARNRTLPKPYVGEVPIATPNARHPAT